MPNLPISQLPELTAITSNAEFAIAQSGVTYKVKAAFASSGNLHGAFHSRLTQSVSTEDVAIVLSAETTDHSQGITVVDNSKFVVASGGTYNVQFSAVFRKIQGGTIEYVSIWPRVNGENVPWSNTDISMANNNELIVAAWNFVLELNSSDYVELLWSTTTTEMEVVAIEPQSNPTRPGTPSFILTITEV